jgi:hypothetical protein
MSICSQESVTKSQPQLCVGYTYSYPVYNDKGEDISGCKLSVHRTYQLSNEWGGIGRIKYLDGNGKVFSSYPEARKWAMEHGYLRVWVRDYNPQKKLERAKVYQLLNNKGVL